MDLKAMLFSFHGRMRRRDWWMTTIAIGLAYYGIWLVLSRVLWGGSIAGSPEYAQPLIGDPLAPLLINLAVTAPFCWAQTAIAARRVHDRNESAWLVSIIQVASVAASYLPVDLFAPGAFSAADPLTTGMAVLSALSMVASLYLLVVLGFRDGTPGPNRFGPSPKGIGGDPADRAAEVFS